MNSWCRSLKEYYGIWWYISRIIQNIRVENKSLWEVATPPGCFRRTWEVAKAEPGSYIDWLVQRPQTIVDWLYIYIVKSSQKNGLISVGWLFSGLKYERAWSFAYYSSRQRFHKFLCDSVYVWVCGQKCNAILKMSEDSLQQEIKVKWELWIYPLVN